MPVVCLVGARLACNNDVLAMVLDSLATEATCRRIAIRIVGILAVQSCAGFCRVVPSGKTVSLIHQIG
jgi:hypothetical protein